MILFILKGLLLYGGADVVSTIDKRVSRTIGFI